MHETLLSQTSPTSTSLKGCLCALIVVLAAALFTAFSGNGPAIPLDTHEVFVARTAEEMIARGNWIVPYLNDQPRIKKPPLCYWLVMAVDRINGGDGVISEWEARIPSIASGVALTGLTFALGWMLLGGAAGFLGALFIVASSGYVSYTHSARPEMVYAALCTAALVGFALSDRWFAQSDRRRCAKWAAWSGWVMVGLATLAKGPHLPLLLVGGWMAAMIADGRRSQLREVMRPFSGLTLALATSMWWFLVMQLRVPETSATLENETINRVLGFGEQSLSEIFNPYYLYRTAGLVLPWVILYPLAIAAPWIGFMKERRNARMLWWVLIVPTIALHISLGRRWYYMLPAMAPLALLMAHGALNAGWWIMDCGRKRVWPAVALLHIAILAAGVMVFYRTKPPIIQPTLAGVGLVLVTAVLAVVALRRRWPRSTEFSNAASRPPIAMALVGVAFFIAAAANGSIWGIDRHLQREFSREVSRIVAPDDAIFGWRNEWEVAQYYNHRAIPSFEEQEPLREALEQAGEAWLLVNVRKPFRLPANFSYEVLAKSPYEEHDESLQLWRVRARRQR